jgi:predicted nucleic acid-binding protein
VDAITAVTRSSGTAFDCVLDASVGIKLFLSEPLSDRAHSLLNHLEDDPPSHIYVPNLFFVECTNILWKYVRRFDYPSALAQANIADLTKLRLHSIPMQVLVGDGLAIAVQYGSSVYDSAYVALSRQLTLPLVTADEALARRFSGTGFDVRFLGDWPV